MKSEKFIDYVALLSLSGIGSIVTNQFHSKANVNNFRLQELTLAFSEKKSVSESVNQVRQNILPEIPDHSSPSLKKGKKTAKGGKVDNERIRMELNLNEKLCTTLFGLPNTFIV